MLETAQTLLNVGSELEVETHNANEPAYRGPSRNIQQELVVWQISHDCCRDNDLGEGCEQHGHENLRDLKVRWYFKLGAAHLLPHVALFHAKDVAEGVNIFPDFELACRAILNHKGRACVIRVWLLQLC